MDILLGKKGYEFFNKIARFPFTGNFRKLLPALATSFYFRRFVHVMNRFEFGGKLKPNLMQV